MRPETKLKLEEIKTIGWWYLYPSELRHGALAFKLRSSLQKSNIDALTQVPEDQVLYGTPRKKPVLEVSPSSTPPGHASKNFHLRSPFSEASTRATSSSLCPKVVQTVPLVCAAVARLAIVFNRATLRCSVRGFEKLRMNARSNCGQTDDLSEWEGRCAKLESLVTRQVAWRVGAEKRLLDLASRGEKLEKQRDLLRRKYKASQSALDAEERRVTRLRTALAEAEEASEVRFGQALELRLRLGWEEFDGESPQLYVHQWTFVFSTEKIG